MTQKVSPSLVAVEQVLISCKKGRHVRQRSRQSYDNEVKRLTNDTQSLLGSGDGHVDLIGVAHEAQVFGQESSVWFLLNLVTWERAHCGYDDVAPLAPWKTK